MKPVIRKIQHSLPLFLKTGCIICSLILASFLIIQIFFPSAPSAVSTFMSSHAPSVLLSSERKLPIYCVNTDKPQVAISFDAAWGNEDTDTLLNILDKYNVKTTFFMTGGWIESYPDDVKKIAAAGHDLGNHSENHKQMSQLSFEECTTEIMMPHEKVKALTGTDMTLFRPPYGDYNNTLIEAANNSGYHVIQWSVDSLDWKDYGADSIVDTVLNHKALEDGAIILMHNGAKYTKDALERVITGLQDKGFEIVPISQLIYTGKYHMDHTGKQFSDE
ncbi:MAG: polysaccharide deacetylase family protein [Coprococcus sp.]